MRLGIGRDQAQFLLPCQPARPQGLIALIVAPFISGDILFRRHDGPVRRCKSEIGEEGARIGPALLQEAYQPVSEIVGGIGAIGQADLLAALAINGIATNLAPGIALVGAIIIAQSLRERKAAFKAASGWAAILGQAQMPLARHHGPITALRKQFGNRRDTVVEEAFIARLSGQRRGQAQAFRHGADAGDMVIRPAHQHGAGGGAGGGSVKACKTDSFEGQLVQVRRVDLTAESPKVGPAQIIGQDNQEVRPLLLLGRVAARGRGDAFIGRSDGLERHRQQAG